MEMNLVTTENSLAALEERARRHHSVTLSALSALALVAEIRRGRARTQTHAPTEPLFFELKTEVEQERDQLRNAVLIAIREELIDLPEADKERIGYAENEAGAVALECFYRAVGELLMKEANRGR